VEEGIHGLIGPNGAGKTTLIDAVTGFERPSAGHVTFLGENIDGWSAHRRARAGLVRTFQMLELYNELTVDENLQSARRASRRGSLEMLNTAVEMFQLGPELKLPARKLPHGRRRMVSIARALACNPSVLLLDEPAAGLDTTETAGLRERLGDIARLGVTCLLVDHDMTLVMEACHRITVLVGGRHLAEATPSEIARDERVREAYLGAE
jgi:ABC-type branched-subunit amino acid transport system ATPase component